MEAKQSMSQSEFLRRRLSEQVCDLKVALSISSNSALDRFTTLLSTHTYSKSMACARTA
jgi:hypothetical protein